VSRENLSISWDQLTRAGLIDLFCCDGEDRKYFYHDFHNRVHHSRGPRDIDIDLQSSKDVFYAPKEAKEILTTNSASGLKCQDVRIGQKGIR
jgi:hypothetical protein